MLPEVNLHAMHTGPISHPADHRPLTVRPAAVLFDMDGLMIDSERAGQACWLAVAQQMALPINEAVVLGMIGLHERLCRDYLRQHAVLAPHLAARGMERCLDELFARWHTHYEARLEAGLPLKPGILPLLDWLHEQAIPVGVATSTQRARAEIALLRTGLRDYFPHVMTGSDIAHPKPAPDIYLQLAARLSVAPADCLVLEDSGPGVRAAFAAGMTPIQIPDLQAPDAALRALGHRVLLSLDVAHALLRAAPCGKHSPYDAFRG